jgi:uncharacterized membrane protein
VQKEEMRSNLGILEKLYKDGSLFAAIAAGACIAFIVSLLAVEDRDTTFLSLQFVTKFNWYIFGASFALGTMVCIVLSFWVGNNLPCVALLAGSVCLYAVLLSARVEADAFFCTGLVAVVGLVCRWCAKELEEKQGFRVFSNSIPFGKNWSFWCTFFAVLAFTAYFSVYSILRYRTYNATNFDLGVFAQMYESLRQTGHAITTLERNTAMTHFAVHCSPFYYLLLPFYCAVPRIETLLILQSLAVGAGAFAVRKIALELKFSHIGAFGAAVLYLLQPGLAAGTFYDFHENKFLSVFLLWLVYFVLRSKFWAALPFALVCLSIKEDAAIYVGAVGLYAIVGKFEILDWSLLRKQLRETSFPTKVKTFRKRLKVLLSNPALRRRLLGIVLLGTAVGGFLLSTWVVENAAAVAGRDGVMTDRLRNFFPPGVQDPGFIDIIKVIIADVGYVAHEIFTAEKGEFLLWVLVPLLFLPLMQKRSRNFLLLLPLVVINLASNYYYQHQVGYQYTYGSVALLVVMALLALRHKEQARRRQYVALALAASLICTVPLVLPRSATYENTWIENRSRIQIADAQLEAIPADADVTVTTWFGPHLYKRKNVYMFPNFYGIQEATEYLVCKEDEYEIKDEPETDLKKFIELIGYEQVYYDAGASFIMVWRLPSVTADGE